MSSENGGRSGDGALWVQCACTALVAVGAAYASYLHGREFALKFGADATIAAIWPLIVDGLLIIATVELWKTSSATAGRWAAWVAFGFGITLSLCANVAAAPELTPFAVTVAACPPLALLLAVELLNRSLKRRDQSCRSSVVTGDPAAEEVSEPPQLAVVPDTAEEMPSGTAEDRMWQFFEKEWAAGRQPTGAELDRAAGTNNYGRRVLRKWHERGRIAAIGSPVESGTVAVSPPDRSIYSTSSL